MTAHIIDFRDYLPEKNPGSNGGREAMNKALGAVLILMALIAATVVAEAPL
jgi:hypothetical protein